MSDRAFTGEEYFLRLARKAYQITVVRVHVHELNNYLTGIMGYSQLALEAQELDDTLMEELKEIEGNSRRSRDTIRKMGFLWKACDAALKPVDFTGLLKEAILYTVYYAERRGMNVEQDYPPSCSEVTAFEEDARDALYCLVTYLFTRLPEGTDLSISLEDGVEELTLAIETPHYKDLASHFERAARETWPGDEKSMDAHILLWSFLKLLERLKGHMAPGSAGSRKVQIAFPRG
ncbi:MAG: hypothetical protein RDV48_06805 [Candidatus Eremiobacteraeota bacterium]|nr:hypothetical protein [Candidatus Eremiobacteraeota bacterium]